MKQYIFTEDQLRYWQPKLDEIGIAYEVVIKDGDIIVEMDQLDALNMGIEKAPRPVSDLEIFGLILLIFLGISLFLYFIL